MLTVCTKNIYTHDAILSSYPSVRLRWKPVKLTNTLLLLTNSYVWTVLWYSYCLNDIGLIVCERTRARAHTHTQCRQDETWKLTFHLNNLPGQSLINNICLLHNRFYQLLPLSDLSYFPFWVQNCFFLRYF